MNYLRNIYLIISILLLVFIGCGRDNQSSTTSKSANLVKPYLIVKSTGYLPKVEIIDEARCLYVRLNSNDGLPRPYTVTLVQIRLIETGEEGWTWSKAIEFDKQ